MQEIKNRRYENAKHFKDGSVNKAIISSGIIHYNNHFGAGDGKKGLREINKSWINDGSKFYYEFANDPTSAGLKANEKITYKDYYNRRGYITSFFPQCNAIDGQVVGNDIVYNNAFSTGQDLVLRPTNSSLQKLVRLRDYLIQDYTFDFEIIIENFTAKGLSIFRVDKTGQNETYSIDPASLFTTPKVFDNPNRITVIGQTENDGTIIKPPKAWYYKDGEAIAIDIQTELYGDAQNGKFYLRKHIPSDFLQDANGEVVYTDTETTINAGVYSIQYLNIDNGLSTLTPLEATEGADAIINTNGSFVWLAHRNNNPQMRLYYYRPVFDISSLSGVTVSSFDFKMKIDDRNTVDDADGNNYLVLTDSTTSSANLTSLTDYTEYADTNNTEISNQVTLTNGQTGDITLSSNSTGVSNLQTAIVNGDSYYSFFVKNGYGLNDVTLSEGDNFSFLCYGDQDTGNEPELIVTYDVATTTPNKQVIIIS